MTSTNRGRPGLLLCVVAASAAVMAAACAGKQVAPDRMVSPGEALFNGRVKADVNCYSCHNGDGTGTWKGPNLGDRVPKLSDDQIRKAILEGPFIMPSFKDKLDDTQIQQIIAWLRERFPK
jgi:mono/diheme cytochrome c family protein